MTELNCKYCIKPNGFPHAWEDTHVTRPDKLIKTYRSLLYKCGNLPEVLVDIIIKFTLYHAGSNTAYHAGSNTAYHAGSNTAYQANDMFCHIFDYQVMDGQTQLETYVARLISIKIYNNQEYGLFKWVGWSKQYNELINMESPRILATDLKPVLDIKAYQHRYICTAETHHRVFDMPAVFQEIRRLRALFGWTVSYACQPYEYYHTCMFK